MMKYLKYMFKVFEEKEVLVLVLLIYLDSKVLIIMFNKLFILFYCI